MRRAEDKIQKAIVDFIRAVAPQCLLHSIPNGGYRLPAEAGILRATGLVAGIPDLALILPGGHVRYLEVKAPGGELSKEQLAIGSRLDEMNVPRAVVQSIEEVRDALRQWGIASREATQ